MNINRQKFLKILKEESEKKIRQLREFGEHEHGIVDADQSPSKQSKNKDKNKMSGKDRIEQELEKEKEDDSQGEGLGDSLVGLVIQSFTVEPDPKTGSKELVLTFSNDADPFRIIIRNNEISFAYKGKMTQDLGGEQV